MRVVIATFLPDALTTHSGGLSEPLVDGRIVATGSDATPDPAFAASDETKPPSSVVGRIRARVVNRFRYLDVARGAAP